MHIGGWRARTLELEAVVHMGSAVRWRHEQIPQPLGLGLGLQILDHWEHLPALALALLDVVIGASRHDLLVDERANPVAPLGLGGLKAEIHAAPTIS